MSSLVKKVMIVDDNEVDNFITSRVLERSGIAQEIMVVNAGQQALNRLKELAAAQEELPAYIFLDVNMPVVDGFVFLYDFEELPVAIKQKCKVFILSSMIEEAAIERLKANPYVVDFLTKPLTPDALEECMSKVLV